MRCEDQHPYMYACVSICVCMCALWESPPGQFTSRCVRTRGERDVWRHVLPCQRERERERASERASLTNALSLSLAHTHTHTGTDAHMCVHTHTCVCTHTHNPKQSIIGRTYVKRDLFLWQKKPTKKTTTVHRFLWQKGPVSMAKEPYWPTNLLPIMGTSWSTNWCATNAMTKLNLNPKPMGWLN